MRTGTARVLIGVERLAHFEVAPAGTADGPAPTTFARCGRADAERRALAILQLVLAAAAVAEPPAVTAAPPHPPSPSLAPGPRPD